MLERQPQLQPMTLFDYLQEKYPGRYDRSKLRTLQKRVQQWKATSGPPKEVMFEQEHRPGEMGLSDFTHFKQATITINGQPFDHLLYHYRLAYSGWQYVQIVQGGESFVALAQGLQKALTRCGGSPKFHRTDSLSAAYRNLNHQTQEDVTQRYEELCAHYQMQPTRNNRGQSHENGSIESPHGHFKRRLHQALLLRGSFDFDSTESYQQFIESAIAKLNRQCQAQFEAERQHLQPLPMHTCADYEVLSVRVTCHSTITVRCVLYTVPSQLIGQRLTIHLYHDCLVGFVGHQEVVQLPRVYAQTNTSKRRARSVNYRHVIHSLRRKPRAFLGYRWREELLPNESYCRLWRNLQEQFAPEQACRLMVECLYIAAVQDKEYLVALWVEGQLRSQTLTLMRLQQQFCCVPTKTCLDTSTVQQHSLAHYDQLLHYDPNRHDCSDLTHTAQSPPAAPHTAAMAGPGS